VSALSEGSSNSAAGKDDVVEFVDQTLRDGQQSLWGLRMRAFEAADALPHLDRAGYKVVDLTGPGALELLTRDYQYDPWEHTDFLIANLPHSETRAGMRTISSLGMRFAPDSIVELWIKTFIRHGVGSIWLFDCLYDMPQMEKAVNWTLEAGGKPLPAVMYGLTDVHDDEFFAARAAEMASWEGVEVIYVEDAPGVLTPERAATLLPALQAATPGIELELHCHNTTGLAPLVYMRGLEAGIRTIHTCSRALANGPSMPSTESMVEILETLGYSHRLDPGTFAPVAENFIREAKIGGWELGVPNEYSLLPYAHQLPGGATGTLKGQLAKHGMEGRFDEVIDEIVRVREELGQPIMATPFSQFVSIQAVLHVITGERWGTVPDEVIQYALGHYGPLPSPVDPQAMERIMAQPRARAFEGWERPQTTLKELRAQLGEGLSDEELLLRFHIAGPEVDAMLAAGPIEVDPRRAAPRIVDHVEELLAESRGARSIAVSRPGFSLQAQRDAGAEGDGGRAEAAPAAR
jgi:oxaloacetate decarboxylase alpha subunit